MLISREAIRYLREQRGWLQTDLAAQAGLSRPYISQIESGEREPSPGAVEAIASALDVPIMDIAVRQFTCPNCGHVYSV